MNFDLRTVYVMDAALYLMLHGAIWVGLMRYRSRLVSMWSASGMVSAFGVACLGLYGIAPDWVVIVLGQVLMAAGNWGRQISLQCMMGCPSAGWMWGHGVFNGVYLLGSGAMYLGGVPMSVLTLVFYGFYALNLLEYVRIGRLMRASEAAPGAQSIEFAGYAFCISLGIKTIALLSGYGEFDLYVMAWDQVAVFVGQFVAISLINVGFLQVFIGQMHDARVQVEKALAQEQEKALLAQAHVKDLADLLQERVEIIRRLTLSNKSAGMGALMSNTAHEVNQPLAAIVLKAEMLEGMLGQPEHLDQAQALCRGVRDEAQKAATVISTLRNLFTLSRGKFEKLDFSALVQGVLGLVRGRAQTLGLVLQEEVQAGLHLTGDAIQLQQVVLNLLNNALDALGKRDAPGPARLSVRCGLVDGRIQLVVVDNGPGLSPALQQDIFKLFKSSARPAHGVGLWLSQAIVKSHQGLLRVESQAHVRTAFCLSLPAHDERLMV